MSGILAKKIGMTQMFEDGKFIPVTINFPTKHLWNQVLFSKYMYFLLV